ncbi:cupin domain-containing protein [Streptomyces endophytica]|uniref:Cupin domain-containing protein n=1 Tax=Streptomyces endophytica TaxID=2991496 RepID=A0ABY6PAV9_9ACTN|nr:cupin domain-containing protein [Streptomyces endophytica]UZJ30722.1 cupin domain-containing protein [Streptomyces endophytica]
MAEHRTSRDPLPEALVDFYGLVPLPREGGRFRPTWSGPPRADGRPEGTAIVMLLTAEPGDYSALHRLPTDEIWHFYRGDPLTLFLLTEGPEEDGQPQGAEGRGVSTPDGRAARTVVLGPDVLGGQHVQFTVPAGTWMAAEVAEGGSWTLFGCTMAPGFTFEDYEHGDGAELAARFPREAARIAALSRP